MIVFWFGTSSLSSKPARPTRKAIKLLTQYSIKYESVVKSHCLALEFKNQSFFSNGMTSRLQSEEKNVKKRWF